MIVKSFIDIDTAKQILDWTETQNLYKHIGVGRHGFFSFLDELNNHPKSVNEIRKKCQEYVGGKYIEPILKDFANEVFATGFVEQHTDSAPDGLKHMRCNIMLQKPEKDGQIVYDGKIYDLDVGDMIVIDTAKKHGVTMVKGNISYKTIVFGFLCHE